MGRGVGALVMALAMSVSARAEVPGWPDDLTGRLEVLALIETLNADLLGNDSATLTLDRWCERHGLGQKGEVVAERIRDADKPSTAVERDILKVDAAEPVRYRRVRLRCGARVLSEADNWYVPSRLTPDMNRQLEETDTSFGRVVKALHFSRHTLSARLLWSPLPDGWETGAPLPAAGSRPLVMPDFLLEHRAVLSRPDGEPISLVVENYTNHVLDFPPPRR